MSKRLYGSPLIPVCPNHDVEMRLRGKMGKPTRFSDQSASEYTLIYFCPVEGCNNTDTRERQRLQIPAPDVAPERPIFSRVNDGN